MTVAVDFSPRAVGGEFRVAERPLKAGLKPHVQASLRDGLPVGSNPWTKVLGYHHSLALRGGLRHPGVQVLIRAAGATVSK